MTQQGDVLLFQTDDGGDIIIENGVVAMSGGLETTVYLSLFGGNEDDDTSDNNNFSWWGNTGEIETIKRFRSNTQNLLQALPATSSNLRRIEDAAIKDLQWMTENNVASSLDIRATIPSLNSLSVTVSIQAKGKESTFEFIENWKSLI